MTALTDSLPDIIERVKAAKGPDRIIDALVKMRFFPHRFDPKPHEIESIVDTGDELRFLYKEHRKNGKPVEGVWGYHSPPVTAALACVVTFVEAVLPGAYWHIAKGRQTHDEPLYAGAIWLRGQPGAGEREPDAIDEHDSSPALAFLLTALRAVLAAESVIGQPSPQVSRG